MVNATPHIFLSESCISALEFTRQQLLDGIRAKCVGANTEAGKQCVRHCGYCGDPDRCDGCIEGGDIRLADMLVALQHKFNIAGAMGLPDGHEKIHALKLYDISALQLCGFWNLRRDSLEDQSHQSLHLIYSILFF